ncbi:MAG: hypothetical protein PHV28_00305 [Kiritimatiellae bacterium]|nr:hypothetical protein [Kiritimatiellia bacterium]
MLGLVKPGDILGGDAEWHNQNPAGVQVMDGGETNTLEQRFQRGSAVPWTWLLLNEAYLRFALPRQ